MPRPPRSPATRSRPSTRAARRAADGWLLERIALAERPAPDHPALAARLRAARRRLALRIAEDQTLQHRTLTHDEGLWSPIGTGLSLKILDEGPDGARYLLRLAPGATLPAHRHPREERCLVLEGRVRLGPLELGPGDWHQVRAGRSHGETTSAGGALLYLEGTLPSVDQLI